MTPLERYLRRLEQRSNLTDEEREGVLALPFDLVSRAARYDLVRPGQRVEAACLVVDGMAGRFEQFGDGGRRTTALYIAGDMCDLHSVAIPTAGWGINALADATIALVPHRALKDVADRYPAVARAFWRDTVVDAAVLSKWVGVLSRLPARERIAHLLCELMVRFDVAGLRAGDRIDLALTQEQVGEMLGISAVHVQRIVRNLRSEGKITTGRGAIRIEDVVALRRMSEFDDQYLLLETHQRM
ncbi:MAG: Crp/Fnr family transcriptional regulator [Sphingomicrobium sp.]